MKNPLTLAGIETATYRFVAQHLNHCATAVPSTALTSLEITNEETIVMTSSSGNFLNWTVRNLKFVSRKRDAPSNSLRVLNVLPYSP